MEKTIWYSVNNGGDGSAYPHWFETMELAEWDQENQSEGFGESCTGSVTFTGDNLKCVTEVKSKEGHYAKLRLDESDKLRSFIKAFYPEDLPKFVVVPGENRYYDILHEGGRRRAQAICIPRE